MAYICCMQALTLYDLLLKCQSLVYLVSEHKNIIQLDFIFTLF